MVKKRSDEGGEGKGFYVVAEGITRFLVILVFCFCLQFRFSQGSFHLTSARFTSQGAV